MATRFTVASSEYLSRTSGSVLDHNANYTWCGWVHYTSLAAFSGDHYLFSATRIAGGTGDMDAAYAKGGATYPWALQVTVAAASTITTGSTITAGTWYFVALRRSSATLLELLVNGVVDVTNTRDVTGRGTADRMWVATISPGGANMSDLRVEGQRAWSRALTDDEILSEMRSLDPVSWEGLWGHWPCHEGPMRALDFSGNARDWTEVNTPTNEDGATTGWGDGFTSFYAPDGAVEHLVIPAAIDLTLTTYAPVFERGFSSGGGSPPPGKRKRRGLALRLGLL